MFHHFIQNHGCLFARGVFLCKLCRFQREQTVAEAAAMGVHDMDQSLRIILHQLIRRGFRRVVSAGDAGAHGNIDNIVSFFEHRFKAVQKQGRVQKAGLDIRAAAKLFVICMHIKVLDIPVVGIRDTVDRICDGKKLYSVQKPSGKIGGTVRENNK